MTVWEHFDKIALGQPDIAALEQIGIDFLELWHTLVLMFDGEQICSVLWELICIFQP